MSPRRLYISYADHLNSPRLITDSTGTAVWRWDQQEPFGDTPPNENPSGLGAFEFPLRMEGWTYFDKETNLLYNWHRYRDPSIGRFPQADPLGLYGGDMSLYVLTKNNPLSFIDPKGLQIAPGGTAGGAAGGFGGLGGFGGRGGIGGRGSSTTGNSDLDRALNGGWSSSNFDDSGSTVGDGDEWRASYLWCKFKCDSSRHVNNFMCRMHFQLLSNDPDAYFLCMRRNMWIWQECVADCKSACNPP